MARPYYLFIYLLTYLFVCLNKHYSLFFNFFKKIYLFFSLDDVAQWIEHWPANQRVIGSIPMLGHIPGLTARYPLGGT